MNDLDDIFEQMSDEELKDYMEDWYAGIYCCSSECLDAPYLDCMC
jgi:hypothetical protein